VIGEDELSEEYVIPSVFNKAVVEQVAEAVAEAALATGVARKDATRSHDVTEIYR
jgi:malate dehydrogenase (oxaloacetate-decarboxylating)